MAFRFRKCCREFFRCFACCMRSTVCSSKKPRANPRSMAVLRIQQEAAIQKKKRLRKGIIDFEDQEAENLWQNQRSRLVADQESSHPEGLRPRYATFECKKKEDRGRKQCSHLVADHESTHPQGLRPRYATFERKKKEDRGRKQCSRLVADHESTHPQEVPPGSINYEDDEEEDPGRNELSTIDEDQESSHPEDVPPVCVPQINHTLDAKEDDPWSDSSTFDEDRESIHPQEVPPVCATQRNHSEEAEEGDPWSDESSALDEDRESTHPQEVPPGYITPEVNEEEDPRPNERPTLEEELESTHHEEDEILEEEEVEEEEVEEEEVEEDERSSPRPTRIFVEAIVHIIVHHDSESWDTARSEENYGPVTMLPTLPASHVQEQQPEESNLDQESTHHEEVPPGDITPEDNEEEGPRPNEHPILIEDLESSHPEEVPPGDINPEDNEEEGPRPNERPILIEDLESSHPEEIPPGYITPETEDEEHLNPIQPPVFVKGQTGQTQRQTINGQNSDFRNKKTEKPALSHTGLEKTYRDNECPRSRRICWGIHETAYHPSRRSPSPFQSSAWRSSVHGAKNVQAGPGGRDGGSQESEPGLKEEINNLKIKVKELEEKNQKLHQKWQEKNNEAQLIIAKEKEEFYRHIAEDELKAQSKINTLKEEHQIQMNMFKRQSKEEIVHLKKMVEDTIKKEKEAYQHLQNLLGLTENVIKERDDLLSLVIDLEEENKSDEEKMRKLKEKIEEYEKMATRYSDNFIRKETEKDEEFAAKSSEYQRRIRHLQWQLKDKDETIDKLLREKKEMENEFEIMWESTRRELKGIHK